MFKELFTESKEINEVVEERLKIEGYNVEIHYIPPKGYVAIGKSPEIKKAISRQYFNTAEEAKEHASLEISGYLDD
jgi:transcriptional antiterminator